MNEEAIQALYDDVSSEYEVGTLDDFKGYLSDSEKRKAFYNEVASQRYEVGSLDEFEEAYGLKKKILLHQIQRLLQSLLKRVVKVLTSIRLNMAKNQQ